MSREAQHPDPRESGAKPPFPSQPQSAPGSDARMDPPADHVFLASQDATYVSGEIYGATGGRTPY